MQMLLINASYTTEAKNIAAPKPMATTVVVNTILHAWKCENTCRTITAFNASRGISISNLSPSPKPQLGTSNSRRKYEKSCRTACYDAPRGISNVLFSRPQTCTSNHRRTLFCTNAVNDEEAASKANAATADDGGPTIFDKIIAKEIPSSIVYEDEKVLAFRDINPQAPVHVIVIPKRRDGLTELGKAEARHEDILGSLLYATKIVAEKEGIVDGFRVVINSGPTACQSVYHLHMHVLGGRQMKWPPG